MALDLLVGVTAVSDGPGVLGVEIDGVSEVGEGLLVAPDLLEDPAAEGEDQCGLRVEFYETCVVGDGLVIALHELVGLAALSERPNILRVEFDGAAEVGERLVALRPQPPLTPYRRRITILRQVGAFAPSPVISPWTRRPVNPRPLVPPAEQRRRRNHQLGRSGVRDRRPRRSGHAADSWQLARVNDRQVP